VLLHCALHACVMCSPTPSPVAIAIDTATPVTPALALSSPAQTAVSSSNLDSSASATTDNPTEVPASVNSATTVPSPAGTTPAAAAVTGRPEMTPATTPPTPPPSPRSATAADQTATATLAATTAASSPGPPATSESGLDATPAATTAASNPLATPTPGPDATTTAATAAASTAAATTSTTIYITMPGSVADFDGPRISAIRSDIAARLKVSVSDVVVTVSAGSVILSVTLPAVAATTLSAQISSGALSSLGGVAVQGLSSGPDGASVTGSQAPLPVPSVQIGTAGPIQILPPMTETTSTPAIQILPPMTETTSTLVSRTADPPVYTRSVFGNFRPPREPCFMIHPLRLACCTLGWAGVCMQAYSVARLGCDVFYFVRSLHVTCQLLLRADSTSPPTTMSPGEMLMQQQLAVSSPPSRQRISSSASCPSNALLCFQDPDAVDNYLGGLQTRPPMAAGADLSDSQLIQIDCPKGSNGLTCSGRGRFALQPRAAAAGFRPNRSVMKLRVQLQHQSRRMLLLVRGAVPLVQLRMPGISPAGLHLHE
jgi:hypothetical protein